MIRALLLLFAVAVAGVAADGDLATGAADARRAAEAQLKETRERILGERADLSRELAEGYRHLDEARAEAAAAAQERVAAEDALRRLRASSTADEQALRGAIVQLYAAARLDPPTATPDDAGIAKAAGGIAARAAALPASLALRLADEEILDRDGLPTRVGVLHLGAFAAVAMGDGPRTFGLLAPTSSGRGMVSGTPLPPQARLKAGAPAGATLLVPVDVDATLARAQARGRGLGDWFASGGPFMWAILAVGLVGLAIIAERARWFAGARTGEAEAERLIAAATRGEKPASRRRPLERVLAAAAASVGVEREAAVERAALTEETALERGLTILAALAGAAPLLGLLGTVTGMIGMFATLAEHGSGNPRLLSSHISIALVTTQFGLIVAVPLLVAHAVLARLRERQSLLIEQAASAFGLRPRVEPSTARYDTALEQVKP